MALPEWYLIVGVAFAGAVFRLVFGLWKAYNDGIPIAFVWTRIVIEIVASCGFGLFGLLIMQVFSKWSLPDGVTLAVVAVAGFAGADLLNLATKKLGVKEITTVFQKAPVAGLGANQQRALEFVQVAKGISNDEYQRLNKVSDSTSTRELNALVTKGFLRKVGAGRATKYVK